MADAKELIRLAPFGRVLPRKSLRLDVRRIHPAIHIAHRRIGQLQIPERIIFDHELVLFLKGRGQITFAGQEIYNEAVRQ